MANRSNTTGGRNQGSQQGSKSGLSQDQSSKTSMSPESCPTGTDRRDTSISSDDEEEE